MSNDRGLAMPAYARFSLYYFNWLAEFQADEGYIKVCSAKLIDLVKDANSFYHEFWQNLNFNAD